MPEKIKAKKDFEPVSSVLTIVQYLAEGARIRASALIWLDSREKITSAQMSDFVADPLSLQMRVSKTFNASAFQTALNRLKTNDCFISIKLDSAYLFFKATFKGIDGVILSFNHPQKVFKVQRRANFRLKIPAKNPLSVEFSHPSSPRQKCVRQVFDLSAGGLSFFTAKDDTKIFRPGTLIEDLQLMVRKTSMVLQARVVTIRTTKNATDRGVLVSVEFINIRPGRATSLAGYIFEEHRKMIWESLGAVLDPS